MLRSIMGFDWQKSNSHWLLLSKFVHSRSPDDFAKSDDWKNVLGELELLHRTTLAVVSTTLDLNQVALDAGDDPGRPRFRFPLGGCQTSLLALILTNMALCRCPNCSRRDCQKRFPSVQSPILSVGVLCGRVNQ